MPNWDEYKETLRRLYVIENRKRDDIVKIMREEYNFDAKANQYDRKFKDWGVRKNLKSKEWRVIKYRVDKSKRAGKQCAVFVGGMLVPSEKLEKEIRRNDFPSAEERWGLAPTSPTTPEGMHICTPPALAGGVHLIANLPWVNFLQTMMGQKDPLPNPGSLATDLHSNTRGLLSVSDWDACKVTKAISRLSATSGSSSALDFFTGLFRSQLGALLPVRVDTSDDTHMDDEASTMPHPNVMEQYACLVILQASNKVMGRSDPCHVGRRLGRFFAPGTGSIFYKDQSPTVQASLETLLSAAVKDGNIQLVKELLNAGTPPDVTDAPSRGWGRTVLHEAVKKQYLEIVQILLRAGADPNAGSSLREKTALQVAASYGNYALVRLLLDYKADHYATYARSGTALQLAVSSLCSDTVSLILSAGADVNAYGYYPKVTALHVAAETGWLESVEILLDAGADVNALGDIPKTSALHLVAERGRLDLVDILLTKGAIAHDERSPEPAVIAAARAGRAAVVRRLLEFPAAGNTAQLAVQHFIRTALSAAVRSGRAEDVDQLLIEAVKAGALEYKHRARLLLKAASRSPIDVVHLLLSAGCDGNAPPITSRWLTPLQAAASQNTVAVVRLLLEHSADINAPAAASRGRTALQAAIKNENPGMIQFLLDARADPNARAARRHGITALESAVTKGDIGSVISLWSHGVDINAPDLPESGMTPLTFAAAGGNAEMTQLLLNMGANPNYPVRQYRKTRTPIQAAAEKGHADIVRMLLAESADVNAPAASVGGVTALQAAAGYGDIKLVRLLLDNSADANAPAADRDGITALDAAARKGDESVAKALIDAGAEVNPSAGRQVGCSPLAEALNRRNVGLTCLFLAHGAAFNVQDSRTALQAAVETGNSEFVQALLDAGATVKAPPSPFKGCTALQAAADRGYLDIAMKLLKAGADVNEPPPSDRGHTALQEAAMNGRLDMTQLLLDAGADVGAPPSPREGITALQAAAKGGYLGIAIKLLEAGVDVNEPPPPDGGRTALQEAAMNGRIDMVQLLLNAGIDQTGGGLDDVSWALGRLRGCACC